MAKCLVKDPLGELILLALIEGGLYFMSKVFDPCKRLYSRPIIVIVSFLVVSGFSFSSFVLDRLWHLDIFRKPSNPFIVWSECFFGCRRNASKRPVQFFQALQAAPNPFQPFQKPL